MSGFPTLSQRDNDILQQFFSGANSYAFAGGHLERMQRQQKVVVQRQLAISLEDLYTGTTKRLKLTRTLRDGTTSQKILTVQIKAGWKAGQKSSIQTRVTNYGTALRKMSSSSLQRNRIPRSSERAITCAQTSTSQSIHGFRKTITHLDGHDLEITGMQGSTPVKPGDEIVMLGEGMPISKQPGKKGALIIKINAQIT